MFCYRERKRLRDEAEADHRADMEASLPPVKEEALALFQMIGRNGDSADSIRELIQVPPKVESWLLGQARHGPRGRRGILKVLNFRRRVLAEFERLLEASLEFEYCGSHRGGTSRLQYNDRPT